jgi:hypothetical protein
MGTCVVKAHFGPSSPGMKTASLAVSASPGGAATAALSGNALTPGMLSIMPGTQDFGMIVQGAVSGNMPFTITNTGMGSTGTIALSLTGSDAAEFQIVAAADQCSGMILAAGGTCTVNLKFTPSGTKMAGAKMASLVATASPGGSDSAALTGTALAPAQLAVLPTSQNLGSVVVGGMSMDNVFTITNNGGVASGVPSASLTGTDAGQYMITTNTCTAALSPGSSCAVAVRFAPSSAGVKSAASLSVTASPGGTATAMLSGTGLTAGSLAIAPSSNTYAATLVGMSTADVTFTVSNTGQTATSAVTMSLTGSDASNFGITAASNACNGVVLQPMGMSGDHCTVAVHFSPGSGGTKNASLQASATTGGNAVAALSGSGLAPAAFQITPSSNNFGGITQGQSSADVTFTVQNTGNVTSGTPTVALTGTNAADFGIGGINTCTAALAAGATCTVQVHFSPGTSGIKSASLQVTAASTTTGTATLSGNGLTLGMLVVSPISQGFGTVVVGSNGTDFLFTFSNNGGSPTGTLTLMLGGANPDQYAIAAGTDNCTGTALAAMGMVGSSCTVKVHMAPTVAGSPMATLQATASPGGTASASLSGTAQSAAALSLTLTTGGKDFGPVVDGQQSTDDLFTITNTGQQTSGVPSLQLTGTDTTQFTINSNTCTAALIGGASCTFKIRFTPTSGMTNLKTALIGASAVPGGVTTTISIQGTAQRPANLQFLTFTPPTSFNQLFPVTNVGSSSAMQTFTIQNMGDQTSGPIAATWTGAPDFTITDNCSGVALAGGATCTLVITFSPSSYGGKSGSGTWSASPGTTSALTGAVAGTGQDTVMLTVSSTGSAKGTVTTGDGKINCMMNGASATGTCVTTYTRNAVVPSVTFTATPDVSSNFVGWAGALGGNTNPATLSLNGSTGVGVGANFTLRTLTLTFTATAIGKNMSLGSVTSSPAGITSCGATCTASDPRHNFCRQTCTTTVTYGTSVTFTQSTSALPLPHWGWGGACAGVAAANAATCMLSITADTSASINWSQNNLMFVSAGTQPAQLGTSGAQALNNADAFCNGSAIGAGLPGTGTGSGYKAWLSISTTNAISRFNSAAGYLRTDGQVFATALSSATAATPVALYPPRIDENGNDNPQSSNFSSGYYPATGTNFDGTLLAGNTCSDWTSSSGSFTFGEQTAGTVAWTNRGTQPCSGSVIHLYCFGTDFATPSPPPPPPPPGSRTAFITNASTFKSGGGLGAFDTACQNAANTAGLPPGTYLAFIATNGGSASGRFAGTSAWFRPDGVMFAFNPSDLGSLTTWQSPLQCTETKAYASYGAFTGGNNGNSGATPTVPSQPGNVNNTCNNWMDGTSSTPAFPVGSPGLNTMAWGNGGSTTCAVPGLELYCLQQ